VHLEGRGERLKAEIRFILALAARGHVRAADAGELDYALELAVERVYLEPADRLF